MRIRLPQTSAEIQNRGISGPQKGLMSFKNEKKNNYRTIDIRTGSGGIRRNRFTLGKHSPPSSAGYSQQAGSKNPTGMHSCCNIFWSTGANHMALKGFCLYPPTLCVCSGGSRISQRRGHQSVSEGTNLLFGPNLPKTKWKWKKIGPREGIESKILLYM